MYIYSNKVSCTDDFGPKINPIYKGKRNWEGNEDRVRKGNMFGLNFPYSGIRFVFYKTTKVYLSEKLLF